MMMEVIPKRRAIMLKTTRGNVDTRLGDEIDGGRAKLTRWSVRMECKDVVKMTSIESQHCGVNGG